MAIQNEEIRRSDRVSIELPIQVAGTDAMGFSFVDDGRTILVNRHGAKILSRRKLVPDQEVSVRCLKTGIEADARVVGQIGEELDGYYYGISFLQAAINPWGIEFPSVEKSEVAVGRIILECAGCRIQELTYLDEFEIEVLEANSILTRYCMRCTESTLWKKSSGEAPVTREAPVSVEISSQEKRREPRRELRVQSCIRSLEFADDVVWTRNVSRGGLCFESRREYVQGWKIEVAIPHSPGGGNIFLPARIARVQPITGSEMILFGLSYIRNPRTS